MTLLFSDIAEQIGVANRRLTNPAYGGRVKVQSTVIDVTGKADGDEIMLFPLKASSVIIDVETLNPVISGMSNTELRFYDTEGNDLNSSAGALTSSIAYTSQRAYFESIWSGVGSHIDALGRPLWEDPYHKGGGQPGYERNPVAIWFLGMKLVDIGNGGKIAFQCLYTDQS